MRVLVACEESQVVCKAFRERGHEAYSCDIQPCSGGHPEWHIQGDVMMFLEGFYKCKCGTIHEESLGKYGCCGVSKFYEWDLIIAFPPCTDLALSGAKHFEKKRENGAQEKSVKFFFELWKSANCLENPKGIMNGGGYIKRWFPFLYNEMRSFGFPFKPSQVVNPYDFGDAAQKPTCLWLRDLPILKSTNMGNAPLFGSSLNKGEFHVTTGGNRLPKWYNLPPSVNRAKIRSKTFPGIAKAMAAQWSDDLTK